MIGKLGYFTVLKMYALIGLSVSPVMTPFQVLVDIPGSGALTKNCCFDLISCVC